MAAGLSIWCAVIGRSLTNAGDLQENWQEATHCRKQLFPSQET